MIVSFVNSKGGTGKTTAITNIASVLRKRGFDLFLVDTDPQGSLSDWVEQGGDTWDMVAVDKRDLAAVSQYNSDDRIVLVDVAGFKDETLYVAVEIADRVVIPIQPTPIEVRALGNVLAVIKDEQLERPDLDVNVLLCRGDSPPIDEDEARETIETSSAAWIAEQAEGGVEVAGWRVVPGGLRDRKPYKRAYGAGISVLDFQPRRQAAAAIVELEAVVDHLFGKA